MPIPTVRLHLDELFSIIKDGPDADENPDLIGRNVTITLAPQLTDRSLVPVEGDPHGYWPEVLKWKVGPAEGADMDWPFTALVPNLADPAMLTDADRYTVVVATTDSPQYTTNRSVSSGVVLTPEDTGTTIDLMPLLPVAAATPTSPVVRGDEGPPGPPGPPPILSATATALAPGAAPTAEFTGDPAAPLLTLGIPRGDKGDPGDPTPFQLRGPGRPDQPATTGGVITGTEPVGTEYVSTDGAGVGAWVWRKLGSTWVCEMLRTGDIDVAHLLEEGWEQATTGGGSVILSRNQDTVNLNFRIQVSAGASSIGVSRSFSRNLIQLPEGFGYAINYRNVGVAGGAGGARLFVLANLERVLRVADGTGAWEAGDVIHAEVSFRTRDAVPQTLTV